MIIPLNPTGGDSRAFPFIGTDANRAFPLTGFDDLARNDVTHSLAQEDQGAIAQEDGFELEFEF